MKKVMLFLLFAFFISSSGISNLHKEENIVKLIPPTLVQKKIENPIQELDSLENSLTSQVENLEKREQHLSQLKQQKEQYLTELDQTLDKALVYIKEREKREDKQDFICLKKRGFIGRSILGRDSCKIWIKEP